MPPLTPSATFMSLIVSRSAKLASRDGWPTPKPYPSDARTCPLVARGPGWDRRGLLAQGLIEHFAGHGRGRFRLTDDVTYLAGVHFVLGDAAGLAGIRVHHGTGAGLYLARASRGHQDVAILAVETIYNFHTANLTLCSK